MAKLMLLVFLASSESCQFLSQMKSVGVTPDDVEPRADYPVVIYNKILISTESYFLNHKTIRESLKKIKLHISQPLWKRDALVCVKSLQLDIDLFNIFWDLGIPNVIMKTPLNSYVYNPFKNILLIADGPPLFTFSKIWRDLNGFEVNLSAFLHPLGFSGISIGSGVDGSFLYELSRWMNFTPIIKKGSNYSITLQQLENKEIEFGGNAHFIRFYSSKIQLTSVVYRDEVCVVMRSGGVLRGWDVFLEAFDWEVWMMILITALTSNFILTFLCPRLSWTGWLPLTLRAMFMIPLRRPPKGLKERLIIGGCLLFGVVVVTTYQATLYHFIRAQVHYKNPDTIQQLTKIVNKTRITDELLRTAAVEMRRKEVEMLVKTGYLQSAIHIIPQCPAVHNLGYPVSYGSPYYRFITHFANLAFEAGLPQAWYRETIIHRRKRTKKPIKKEVRVLNISDFEVAFFSLAMGLMISTAIFLIELISNFASDRWWFKTHLDPPQNQYINYHN